VAHTPDLNVDSLPADTIAFANRMFDAAREGNSELLLQAVDAGLPPNLTNSKGASLVASRNNDMTYGAKRLNYV